MGSTTSSPRHRSTGRAWVVEKTADARHCHRRRRWRRGRMTTIPSASSWTWYAKTMVHPASVLTNSSRWRWQMPTTTPPSSARTFTVSKYSKTLRSDFHLPAFWPQMPILETMDALPILLFLRIRLVLARVWTLKVMKGTDRRRRHRLMGWWWCFPLIPALESWVLSGRWTMRRSKVLSCRLLEVYFKDLIMVEFTLITTVNCLMITIKYYYYYYYCCYCYC